MVLTRRHYWALAVLVAVHVTLLALMLNRQLDFLFDASMHRLGPGTDFSAYTTAGAQYLRGEGIYGHGPGFGYRYHPLFAATAGAALSLLSFQTAFLVWVALNEVLLLASLLVVRTLISRPRDFVLATALALLFSPYYLEIYMGNNSFIVGALLLLAFQLYRQGALAAFATLLTVTIFLKPIGLVFLPLLLFRGHLWMVALVTAVVAVTAVPYFLADPLGFERLVAINFEAVPAPGWVVHAGNQGLHNLIARICAHLDGVSTARLASFEDLSQVSQWILSGLPALLAVATVAATWVLRGRLGLCIFLGSACYLLGYKDVWESSYAFLVLGLVELFRDSEGVNSRLLKVCAVGLALPTAFVFYDVALPPGPIEPEHHWNLWVSLVHHVTKPLWLVVLYVACMRVAWTAFRGGPRPERLKGETGFASGKWAR